MSGNSAGCARTLRPCPNGCGRMTRTYLGQCYQCRRGAVWVGYTRLCLDCGENMPGVVRGVRCRSCNLFKRHAEGNFADSAQRRWPTWKPDEDATLRELAGTLTADQIGAKLGRSVRGVRCRAARLGLYLQTQDWTLHRVELLFGTWYRTIEREWVRKGLLAATHVTRGGRSRSGGEWRIKDADLERFILEYPWAYDVRRMRPLSRRLVQLAERASRRAGYLECEDAAARIGLKVDTLRHWCMRDAVPYKRRFAGSRASWGRIVIREADLEQIAEIIHERRAAARATLNANLKQCARKQVAA